VPNLGVAVALLHEGKVLLTKREDAEMWCLPGGAVDDGESLAAAAVREVREEAGLDVRLTRLVGLYSRPEWSNHVVVFAAELVGGTLTPQPGEAVDAGFFDPEALPEPLLWWWRRPIAEAVAGVGGSGAWTLDAPRPFPPGLSRAEIYAMRDRSGLSRAEFAEKYINQRGPEGERSELPPVD
jgi:ADP-ribose pyrophosphatase YjhB (NUDIX family)